MTQEAWDSVTYSVKDLCRLSLTGDPLECIVCALQLRPLHWRLTCLLKPRRQSLGHGQHMSRHQPREAFPTHAATGLHCSPRYNASC